MTHKPEKVLSIAYNCPLQVQGNATLQTQTSLAELLQSEGESSAHAAPMQRSDKKPAQVRLFCDFTTLHSSQVQRAAVTHALLRASPSQQPTPVVTVPEGLSTKGAS